MLSKIAIAICLLITLTHHLRFVEGQSSTQTSPHYVAEPFVSHHTVQTPRGIVLDEFGDILVVDRASSQVHALFEDAGSVKSALIIEAESLRLNHGITYDRGFIYASNNSTVFRWGYSPSLRSRITSEPEVVVREIPNYGDHLTRTIIIDRNEFLYVTVGSASNVDKDESRALIRRFNLAEGFPLGGYLFKEGEIFVDGVRNSVGLAFDGNNQLWGVDCGADNLFREDLGGDIHNTNPADKLIQFWKDSSYGYPYCWTVDELPGHFRGEQLAWPTFMHDGVHDDAWCQNAFNSIRPTLALPAHNAPLGLTFYDGASCESSSDAFPCSMKGDVFVAFHGSWNREPPSGYRVVRIPIDRDTGHPTGEIQDIIYETDPKSCVTKPETCFRPVDLVFDRNGHLLVTSDTSSEIIRVRYKVSSDSPHKETDRRIVVAIIGILFIALFTGIIIGMIASRYSYLCCPSKELPYHREDI